MKVKEDELGIGKYMRQNNKEILQLPFEIYHLNLEANIKRV